MKHTVPHDLEPDKARLVTDKALHAYKERFAEFNPEVRWQGDDRAEVEFKAKGVTMKGTFELRPGQIAMDMDVPFVFKLFQKKAIEVVEREIKEWIGRAKRGEL